jgi:hypothetical protein
MDKVQKPIAFYSYTSSSERFKFYPHPVVLQIE